VRRAIQLKVVIPAAGVGTRLLSATKEQPKEMLPVFARSANGELCVKPLLQLVFEQLFDFGLREYCFVVGRSKRSIEDHFTPDHGFISDLNSKRKNQQSVDLERFYQKVDQSKVLWVNQPSPKGLGDAVMQSAPFAGSGDFLVHAGDTYIVSPNNDHFTRLVRCHEEEEADVTLLLQEVEDTKPYGIASVNESGKDRYFVTFVEEKPDSPKSNLALMPIYLFKDRIFEALEKTEAGVGGEIQLTDAIQKMIDWGLKVMAVALKPEDVRLDIGTPKTYWEALQSSHSSLAGAKV